MRWNPKKPLDGQYRDRLKFAFLPTRMENGEFVWLERYWVQERYFWLGFILRGSWTTIIRWACANERG